MTLTKKIEQARKLYTEKPECRTPYITELFEAYNLLPNILTALESTLKNNAELEEKFKEATQLIGARCDCPPNFVGQDKSPSTWCDRCDFLKKHGVHDE